jgi:hypothetical protein
MAGRRADGLAAAAVGDVGLAAAAVPKPTVRGMVGVRVKTGHKA